MSATRTESVDAGSRRRETPKPSVRPSSTLASASPVTARRHGSTTAPATAALVATTTNDTAYTPPSSAIWIAGSCAYWL
jgi:hypothetical protein